MTPLRVAGVLLLWLLAGCAQPGTLVVVLPGEDGSVGRIDVSRGGDSVTLDTARASASVDTAGGLAQQSVDQAMVDTAFGRALAARPIPPRKFVLYFELDSDTLTPESVEAFEQVFDDISARKHFEVTVVGHTDTTAATDYNHGLSLERARQIESMLVDRGLAGDEITAYGRGELDPLVATADDVAEPLNRRVEIMVR